METTGNEEVIEGLRNRYPQIHPLIFHRSVERANDLGDLFDILEEFPSEYPIVWDESEHCWKHTKDLSQKEKFDLNKIGG